MQDCHKSQKIALCMVGLPARGKTYISRKLHRYLNWLGYNCKVFNIGNYRREICGTECDKSFFDSKNEQATKARNECAQMALNDLINYLNSDGEIAIFDGTNTTKERRNMVQCSLLQQCQNVQTLWIESICDDADVIQNNIRLTKLNNPDYVSMNPEDATKDFLGRIKMYEEVYQKIDLDENLSFIKLINIGEDIQIHKVKGYLLSKIISYLMNLHIYPRPIYLTRHGGSTFNQENRVGGDCDLSQQGIQYSEQLGKFLLDEFPTQEQRNQIHCLTSTMKRATHTAEIVCNILKINYLQLKTLDEINVGICDGLTYTQIAIQFPEDFAERKVNKLTYRYPRGESYLDLISRIEPIIYEIERSREPVLVIGHQAILRCLYAYFHRNEISEVPQLEIPIHAIIKLTPAAYYCEEIRIKIDPETGERKQIEEDLQIARINMLTKKKSYILL
ncbi:unnamed protein product [Paramecium pentaurelia]|uniref:6-phosphofructo-2-kinase domain-containing protein n=1 Tax=Paramecium pentaurelia TaxID=43138 RepID=A0A8S1VTF0_9CILI|nr:unnamed protein product [Paramecium pentaurelia]